MTGDELLDAMEHIDSNLIEVADAPVKKRRKPYWAAAVAAILVLAIGVSVFWPKLANIEPTESTQPLMEFTPTAEMLAKVFPVTDSSTSYYTLYPGLTIEDLSLNPIEQKEGLTIYSLNYPPMDETIFRSYVDHYLSKCAELVSIPTPEYHIIDTSNGSLCAMRASVYSPEHPDFQFSARYSSYDASSANLFLISLSLTDQTISINHKDVCVMITDSDEMTRKKLADTIAHINNLYQTNFTDIEINRTDTRVLIQLYEETFLEYISLSFYPSKGSEDQLYCLQKIDIRKQILSQEEFRVPLGQARMLSVKEAEELLEKGYIFKGGCPNCGGSWPKIDFSDYDAVGMEYVWGNNKMGIPFYTFYKEIESVGIARVYVPAVETEGLEEYFAKHQQTHE